MLWHLLDSKDVHPKYLLNGFPKSGLHLVALMTEALCDPAPPSIFKVDNWWGTFQANSWSNEWQTDMRKQFFHLARLRGGQFLRGHVGWRQDVRDFLYLSVTSVVFIYRDLRDVAVSQAHHVLSVGDDQLRHPAKPSYQMLGSFDAALMAVIEGMKPWPGIFERWPLYAPWLDEDWVLKLRYEDIITDREATAREILTYGINRTLELFPAQIRIDKDWLEESAKEMAAASYQTDRSPTFRKGETGDWREAFQPEHVEAFKRCDVDDWLVRLGYEKDGTWNA